MRECVGCDNGMCIEFGDRIWLWFFVNSYYRRVWFVEGSGCEVMEWEKVGGV